MVRLPPSPLSPARDPETPKLPRWVLGLRGTPRETNWEAQAIGLCVFVVCMATFLAGTYVLSFLVRHGF